MKKFLSVALILVAVILAGCGSKKTKSEAPTATLVPAITHAEAQSKLNELSTGLDSRYDDMREVTFCKLPVDIDLRPPIWIIPYVVVDKNFDVALYQDILYVGNEPLYFEKLYVKTTSGVETFQYKKTVKSYAGEEYNGAMYDKLYKKLQEALKDGHAKFRLEGRTFGERELTATELSNMAKVFAIYEFFSSVKVDK